jgi:DNA-binding CsgD family transcriptional regulator
MDPEIIIAALYTLTPREAEAVLWVAQGKTSWEAGRILGVADRAIDAHVARAAEKLEASNRAHLVARAFVKGVLAVTHSAVCLVLAVVAAFGMQDQARVARVVRGRRDDAVEVSLRAPGGA